MDSPNNNRPALEPYMDDAELDMHTPPRQDGDKGEMMLPSTTQSGGHSPEEHSPKSSSQSHRVSTQEVSPDELVVNVQTEPISSELPEIEVQELCESLHELLKDPVTPDAVLKVVQDVRADEQWNQIRTEYRSLHPDDHEGHLVKCIKKAMTKEEFGEFRERMQENGVEDLLPPDHNEPLYPKEIRNIIVGYTIGFLGVALSLALDLTGVAEDLSDLAQRPACNGPCPRLCELQPYDPFKWMLDSLNLDKTQRAEVVLRCGMRINSIQYMGPIGFPGIWMGVVGAVFFMCLLTYLAGLLHTKCGWKVNYTRKVVHCTGYIINVIVRFVVGSGDEIETVATLLFTSCMILMCFHVFLLKPIRKRVGFARTMFASVDRAEDRPYTLLWLTTQNAAYFLLFIPLTYALIAKNRYQLMLIPVLIIGFGDGLAEPVGITWGKHKYTARAIWYNGKCCAGSFTRSIEGSAVVYGVSLVSCLACWPWWANKVQVGVAAGVIPVAVTLAEAFGPHAWDNPFLLAVGGGIIVLLVYTIP